MSHRQRTGILILLTALIIAGVYLFVPAFPQDIAYHGFADTRNVLGIPHVGDVLSNAPFTLVGVAGFGALFLGWFGVPAADARTRLPYAVFFAGLVLVGPASGYYHWAPNNLTLYWDRVFLTVAFMGLVGAIIADRIHGGPASGWVLAVLVATGFWSVEYWSASEAHGVGDLRAYFLVQFYPLLAVPLVLWLFPEGVRVRTRFIAMTIGVYVLAKIAELLDKQIFALLDSAISGHTIKHLLAALGPVAIIAMMRTWPRAEGSAVNRR